MEVVLSHFGTSPVSTALPGSPQHVQTGIPLPDWHQAQNDPSLRALVIIRESEFREHCLLLVLSRAQIQEAGSPTPSEFLRTDMCSFIRLLPVAQSSPCPHTLQSHIHILAVKYVSRVKDTKGEERYPVLILKLLTVCWVRGA